MNEEEPRKRIDTGGPAFPSPICCDPDGNCVDTREYDEENSGMSLRQYLAAQALNGMLSDQREGSFRASLGVKKMCEMAFTYADAMIEARKQST